MIFVKDILYKIYEYTKTNFFFLEKKKINKNLNEIKFKWKLK